MDPIVKDSSIYSSGDSFSSFKKRDAKIRVGQVRDVTFNVINNEPLYTVEVLDNNDRIPVPCRQMRSLGGVFNYEENILRSYNADPNKDETPAYTNKAGDLVVIAYLNGDAREGIILGGITHPAISETALDPAEGPQYYKVFNGVETVINTDGEMTVTFKGQPTNLAKLQDLPNDDPVPDPEYDLAIGGTNYKFEKDGSWNLTDNAQELPQSIRVDKPNGKIVVTSGAITLTMTKEGERIDIKSKEFSVVSDNTWSTKTKDWKVEASATAKLKSPKVAIGTDGTELLDEIVKLIEALGAQTIITPVGPAAPVQASPQWSQVEQVKSAINKIKGTL